MTIFIQAQSYFYSFTIWVLGACGAVRIDRRGLPVEFKKSNLSRGVATTFSDGPLMGLKWKDKRQVAILCTINDDTTIDKRQQTRRATSGLEVILKSKVRDEYNTYMGGVDKTDQLVTYYGFAHCTNKGTNLSSFTFLKLQSLMLI